MYVKIQLKHGCNSGLKVNICCKFNQKNWLLPSAEIHCCLFLMPVDVFNCSISHFCCFFIGKRNEEGKSTKNLIEQSLKNFFSIVCRRCTSNGMWVRRITSTRGQFQQRFTSSFCTQRSQKRKKDNGDLTVFFALLGSALVKAAN